MDAYSRMKMIAEEVKEQGFYKSSMMLSNLDLEALLDVDIPEIKSLYNEERVDQKIFRKREDHEGRLGDAAIVALENPEKPPYLILDDKFSSTLKGLYLSYIGVLGYMLDEEINEDAKLLLNYQFYKAGGKNSLPFHFDAEIFKGDWGKEYIELEEGLIPRMVMVVVLENENDGQGLKIMRDGEVIDLELIPGDILYFDNTAVLHGVPEDLPNKRTMIGFRSFEIQPLYFRKDGFLDGTGIIDINTEYVKGEAIELSTEEAREMLEGEGWYY